MLRTASNNPAAITGGTIATAAITGGTINGTPIGGTTKAAAGFTTVDVDYTNTATIGAVTINKASGKVRIAAAGTSVVVTNSLVVADSRIFCEVMSADGGGRVISVVPAAGSFTITIVASTLELVIAFFVIN